ATNAKPTTSPPSPASQQPSSAPADSPNEMSSKSNISPALNRLTDLGLLWRISNGLCRINPRIAFKGSQEEWTKALEEVPADVPEVVLPNYRRRPPRTNRSGLAAAG
ncbi:hypothetical protein, partial [Kitasatospora saccharophila]